MDKDFASTAGVSAHARGHVDTPQSKSDLELQKPLEQFRAKTKRLKIHPAELTVLWIVCAHICALPWALGGMRLWAQIPSLVIAFVGFVVALLPRNYTPEHTGSNSFRLITWPKLIKFPIFWLGLALLGLVVTQGLNPAWDFRTDGKSWWMQAIPHLEWLPSGVRVPFERWGPWRMLIIYGSIWLTACTVWIGFTRRKTLQAFFIAIAANGLALALFGIAQRMLGNGKMFWFFVSPNEQFFSSFIYKNHGGSYLDLTLAVTCGLAAWYYLRGLRRLEKSNPAGVFAFFATCIAVAILVSYARGATIVMLAFLLVSIGAFVVHQLSASTANRKPVVAVALILIFGFFLKTGFDTLQSREAWTRLKAGITDQDMSLSGRALATKASLDMLSVHWLGGTGAGSYQFLFPTYQVRYPDLVSQGGQRMFWEHAHNDLVEFPIELGLGGMMLLLAAADYLAYRLLKSYFWENPLSGSIVFGLFLLLCYSWWDFPLHGVAVLQLWCVLAVSVVMWTATEEQNAKS